ncbi:MAG: hypothetical protein M3004_11695, partial [Bacteroidota bacterium]|nr:hypothetical protein [Bacteroidota bacterium]
VPMFYYLIHFYVIHIAAIIAGLLSGFTFKQMATGQPLPEYGFKLWVVYLVWISIVVLLYYPCKKYAKYKFSHPEKWWLSYL